MGYHQPAILRGEPKALSIAQGQRPKNLVQGKLREGEESHNAQGRLREAISVRMGLLRHSMPRNDMCVRCKAAGFIGKPQIVFRAEERSFGRTTGEDKSPGSQSGLSLDKEEQIEVRW